MIEMTIIELKIHDAKVRADAIDEVIEYYKPCNDCYGCLEKDRDYFKESCELNTQISYAELVEDLEQLKGAGE